MGDTITFKNRDASSYDSVVDSFDRHTTRFSIPMAKHAAQLVLSESVNRVIDIGTGTGIVAMEIAKHIASPAHVTGIDLSQGMLARARENSDEAGLEDRVNFVLMDAEKLEFEDNSVDGVVSLYSLLHLPDPERAVKEFYRVLRTGGRIVIGVGSGPSRMTLAGFEDGLARMWARFEIRRGRRLEAPEFIEKLVAELDDPLAGHEETDLAREHKNRASVLPKLVRDVGFNNIERSWKGHYPLIESPEEFWDLQTTFSSIARKRLAEISIEALQMLRDEFISTSSNILKRGGKLVYPNGAVFVTATKF